MGTHSQACSKAKCVLVDPSSYSEAAKSDSLEEECSVQGDREDECFRGVCEVKYATESESKPWIACSNCKVALDVLMMFLCVLNALEREENTLIQALNFLVKNLHNTLPALMT